jgi:hypothetical protein
MSSNDGEVEAVSIQEFRPAPRTGDFFRTLFDWPRAASSTSAGSPT